MEDVDDGGGQELLRAGEITQNRGVVRRGVGENFSCKRSPFFLANLADLQILDHTRIIARVHDHNHRRVILCGRAEHRGAADVDVLDRLRKCGLRLGNGFAKRIEVYGDEIDRCDAVLLERREVVLIVTSRQQSAVHLRMQRLHPAVHHFRESRDVLDANDRDPLASEGLGGAAGRDDLPLEGHQFSGELDNSAFVGD